MYTKEKHFLTTNIAAFTYCDGIDVISELKPGVTVTLKVESDNPYDPDAVAVYFGETKIGYIPKTVNSDISQLLYFGHDVFDAKISTVKPESHPEDQYHIVVRVKDNR